MRTRAPSIKYPAEGWPRHRTRAGETLGPATPGRPSRAAGPLAWSPSQ